jgi:hypothetical protein
MRREARKREARKREAFEKVPDESTTTVVDKRAIMKAYKSDGES